MVSLRNRGPRLLLLVLFAALALARLSAQFTTGVAPVSASTIPKAAIVQPQQLHRELQAHASLLILQVGSRILYEGDHIPGSEYAGPGSTPEGLAVLRSRVRQLSRTQAIVIYCGCCPWDRCPNIGPAWQLLHSMGFTNVRALYLNNNFGSNWVGLGYDVESSQ
ncbi:MAG: rhodanese-like domain-containing protein [Acidobacteriaceae bacterium]